MLGNGKVVPRIPAHQIAKFKCPGCGDEVFEMKQCIKLAYDRLDAKQELHPVAINLCQCLNCKGYLTKDESGKWVAVHHDGDGGETWDAGGPT